MINLKFIPNKINVLLHKKFLFALLIFLFISSCKMDNPVEILEAKKITSLKESVHGRQR